MLISASSARNELVLRSFWRRCVSLCKTSGWSMTTTAGAMASEDGTIAPHPQGRAAARALLGRDLTPRAPGAALEHLRQGELVCGEPQRRAHPLGGAIEERDRERAPLDDDIRGDVVLVLEDARVPGDEHA